MKKSTSKISFINIFVIVALFCFVFILGRVCFLALSDEVDGVNLKQFASNRSTTTEKITARRGNIYDKSGEALAINVSSYTLIAYLDASRSEGEDEVYHVKDKKMTAKKLATVLRLKEKEIYSILNQRGLYQTEFGSAGKGLTELEKDAIKALDLPGIDFIEDTKRYYPNGNFASYTIGYAKSDEEGVIKGEYGLESLLEGVLKGKDGSITYQRDLNGYKIAGTKFLNVDAKNGNDVYLTIDSNIQFFIEQALREAGRKYGFEWLTLVVADAKTGAILGLSQEPTFDPNTRDIKNWLDITTSAYEPGSIMKTYTYMAAMEAGTYKGDQTFKSGVFTADDGTKIYDWNRVGFGNITYDQGFAASSNVGIINIINRFINKTILYDYFNKLGFGSKTGITLDNEDAGVINFRYQTEVLNAGFGQGIMTTPIQHIQALTSIANDGVVLKPYIIDKVTDHKGKVVFEGKREEKDTVASHKTVEKIKDLMYDTVNSKWGYATGSVYRMKGYDLIGKTGTAQLINEKTGNYHTSDYYTIKSFAGMWPKDDPEVIIYASVKKPKGGSSKALSSVVKSVVENTSKYLNIFSKVSEKVIENNIVDNYLNLKTSDVTKKLNKKKIDYAVVGSGDKIIGQYPERNEILDSNDKLLLVTNDKKYTMPDFIGYSKKQVRAICDMLHLKCSYDGYGYVSRQSVLKGKEIKTGSEVTFTLKSKY